MSLWYVWGESGQSASSIPSGLGDSDDDVAKGDIVVIKTDGELPFTLGKVLTDPMDSSQQADVQYYMPSCRPMNAQNLEGSWTMSFTKKSGSRRLTKEIHSVGLDWVALTWGTQSDMCSGASSSTGLHRHRYAHLCSSPKWGSRACLASWSVLVDG